jgi:membrane protease YdiL (CAAX protease family)
LTARWELAFFLVQGGAIAIAGILFWQARRVSRSEQALERVGPKLARMRLILPHTDEELRRFLWLSLTAGICEELLYRGFLLAYFGHWLGPIPSLVISSAIFGLGHLYQGVRGVGLTGFVGALLGVFYLLSGSIFPSMLLHAGGDMYSGWIAHAALSRERLKPLVTSPASDPPPTP